MIKNQEQIHLEYSTLYKLLDKRIFQIPEYQRAYSWTKEERNDLFNDLHNIASGKQEIHFMATIVCVPAYSKEEGDYGCFDIVDGQQRLTTLTVLLKAIQLSLNINNSEEKKINKRLMNLLVPNQVNLPILQTNHDKSEHYRKFIRSGELTEPEPEEPYANLELIRCINECNNFVDLWKKDEPLSKLEEILLNNLHFTFQIISNREIVYSIFEGLNSRGITVSWLDRLKSILMGIAYKMEGVTNEILIQELHSKWGKIYEEIGSDSNLGSEILRFSATLWSENPRRKIISEKESVDIFRKAANSGNENVVIEIANMLVDVARERKAIQSKWMKAVTKIVHARLLAVAIRVKKKSNDEEFAKLIEHWEKITFKIFGVLGKDGRTGVGAYVNLAWRVVKEEELTVEEIHREMAKLGGGYSIERSKSDLEKANFYKGWQNELLYFMYKYEENLLRKKGQKIPSKEWVDIWKERASDSVEHILPQSTKRNKELIHRLGNLLILPLYLNARLKDSEPKSKFPDYRDTGLLIAREVAKNDKWQRSNIIDRTKQLLEWAIEEWDD